MYNQGNQRPLYDSRRDDYNGARQQPQYGQQQQSYSRPQQNNLDQDVRHAAMQFARQLGESLDRNVGNKIGEQVYSLVDGGIDRYLNDVVRNFQAFEQAAGRDNPVVVAGSTLAAWLMFSIVEQSDQRFRNDIIHYGGNDYDVIRNASNDYNRIMTNNRGGGGYNRDSGTGGYGSRDQQQGQSRNNDYGSRGQNTSLVNPMPSEPAGSNDRTRTVKITSLADLAAMADQDELVNASSTLVDSSDHRDQQYEQVRTDPTRAHTSSMADWAAEAEERPAVTNPVSQRVQPRAPASFTPVSNARPPEQDGRRITEGPLEYGDDPMFNKMMENMRDTAVRRDSTFDEQQRALRDALPDPDVEFVEENELELVNGQVRFKDDFDDLLNADEDGILENFDDVSFDPADDSVNALDLLNFAVRTLVDPTVCNGWKLYELERDGNYDYDRSINPYPRAYNAHTHVKFRFISPKGLLVEFLKPKFPEGTEVEMQDHIAELLVTRSKGTSVNIVGLLQGVEKRMNVKANRVEVKENKPEGIEAIVATADVKAFDTQPRLTTSDSVATAIRSKLAVDRSTTIEGFNERRLELFYLGAEGFKQLEQFRHSAAAPATFDILVKRLPMALGHMPTAFCDLYRNRLTARFNDFLRNRMGMDFDVEDFFEDFEDARAELIDQLGELTTKDKLDREFKSFSRFVKIMPRSAVDYKGVYGEELATAEYAVFATTISTINLPFDSKEGMGCVPEEDERFVGVAESDSPYLYKLLSTIRKSGAESFNNVPDVIRVITTDNAVYYVDTGAFASEGDCYIISHRNRVAELLS